MDARRPNNVNEPIVYTTGTPGAYNRTGIPFYRRVSWGAIIAGALVALVTLLLLNLLGIGIGLGAIDPMEGSEGFSGLGTGAIIWWVVSNLIAIFTGAYVAGRMAGVPLSSTSTLHGILSWCLFTLASFWMLTTALGSLVSGVGSVVAETLRSTNVEQLAQNNTQGQNQSNLISMSEIRNEVNQVLRNNGNAPAQGNNGSTEVQSKAEIERTTDETAQRVRQNVAAEPNIPEEEIEQIARDEFYRNGRLVENIDRQNLSNTIQNRTNLSQEEAREVADVMANKHSQAKRKAAQQENDLKQQAKETGREVAEKTSTAAIWAFVALALGAVVSGVGGRLGKPNDALARDPEAPEVYK